MNTHVAGHPSRHSSWSVLCTAASTVLAVVVGLGIAEAWHDQPDNQPMTITDHTQKP